MPSYYWGGLEENDVGIDEFMQLSKLIGFEAQFCINMMTSSPFKARQLVEYLNAPQNIGMGRLRMLNGYLSPYGVRLFEMDNEPGRKWTAEQYAHQCVLYAREMRTADPSIELMFAAYSYSLKKLRGMLDIVGQDIQYVIYRDGDPDFVFNALAIIGEYNCDCGTCLRLVNTEWVASCYSPEPFEIEGVPTDFRWTGTITNDYRTIFSTQQRSWNYALNGAHRLLDYISYGGDFALANFNNLCNTWGQNLMEASAEAAWLSCMGTIFAFFARHFVPCIAQTMETGDALVYALMTRAGSLEQMYIVNHGSAEVDLQLPSENWAHAETLAGKSRLDGNTREHSVVMQYKPAHIGIKTNVPGLSVSVYKRHK